MKPPQIRSLLLVGVLALGGAGLWNYQRREAGQLAAEREGGPVTADVFDSRRRAIEAALEKTLSSLGAHDSKAAWTTWQQARADLEQLQHSETGVRFADWHRQILARLTTGTRAEYQHLQGLAAGGELAIEALEEYLAHFDVQGAASLRGDWGRQLAALDLSRARLAVNSVRIEIDCPNSDYAGSAQRATQASFGSPVVLRLVPGRAAGELERSACWQVYDLRIEPVDAQYVFVSPNARGDAPAIPQKLRVSFKPRYRTFARSTWDAVSAGSFEVEVPERLSVSAFRNPDAEKDYVVQLRRTNAAKLGALLDGWLAGLPVFAVKPAAALPATAQGLLTASGGVDLAAAESLALNDPQAFQRLLPDLLPLATTDSLQTAVRALLITRGAGEPHDGWVTASLAQSPAASQRLTAELLRARPWYGNFGPLLSLLRTAKDVLVADTARASVVGFANEPPVHDAFLDLVQNPGLIASIVTSPGAAPSPLVSRADFASALIRLSPPEQRAGFAPWLRDKDERFASQIFMEFRNADSELAMRLARENFALVPPSLQTTLLQGLRLTADAATPADLAMIATAVQFAPQINTRNQALRCLLDASFKPAVWDTLASIPATGLPNPSDAVTILSRLAVDVRRARPERAESWLSGQLRLAQKNSVPPPVSDPGSAAANASIARQYAGLRHTLMHELLAVPGVTAPRIELFRDLIGEDPQLLTSAAQAIRQYKDARSLTWDWSAAAVEEILAPALRSSEKAARYAAAEAMGFALNKAAQAKFAPGLQQALAVESDPQIKRLISAALASPPGAPPK